MGFFQSLADFIARNLLRFWPIARIYTYQCGIRVRCGHLKDELSAGLHFRIPFIDEVWRMNVNERAIDLREGSVSTLDHKSVVVSGNLSYRIQSVGQVWRNVQNFDDSLANIAIGRICTEVARRHWEDVRDQREQLERELLASINEEVAAWGVTVTRLYLTDFVESRHYRMFNQNYNYVPSTGQNGTPATAQVLS